MDKPKFGGVTDIISSSHPLKVLISLAPLCFGVSIGLALAYRYLASDGLFHHFRAIKVAQSKPELEERIMADEDQRNEKFIRSGVLLRRSALALALGAGISAVSFVWIIWEL
jgi:hypothetical protein